jgi:hypothetical protein
MCCSAGQALFQCSLRGCNAGAAFFCSDYCGWLCTLHDAVVHLSQIRTVHHRVSIVEKMNASSTMFAEMANQLHIHQQMATAQVKLLASSAAFSTARAAMTSALAAEAEAKQQLTVAEQHLALLLQTNVAEVPASLAP